MVNNPYIYHPHPSLKRAADDICLYISQHEEWSELFEQGKMLGVLLCSDGTLLRAYSGVINGLNDPDHYFVPPIYDLANPDDFYLQEDREISELNQQISQTAEPKILSQLKQLRKEKSLALQLKIFRHFDILNARGQYKNIVEIFESAKRGLPPGGSGECAAPRLLQQAFRLGLEPVALAEFWYGRSPRSIRRRHGQFYPSCIEKCSPILRYMFAPGASAADPSNPESAPLSTGIPTLLYEDADIVIVSKPGGLLSVPAKDPTLPSVESWLKQRYPDCRLPFMLAHRLDQATSGILIAARNAQAHKALQLAFEQKTIHKRYLAWIEGELPSECGSLQLPICPNPDDRPRQVVDWQFGKPACTRYNVIKREAGRTLIELFPLTGRTHQLRLHCASPYGLDHPIVGDVLYFAAPDNRLMLHAESLMLPADLLPSPLARESAEELKLRVRIPLEFHYPAGFE